MSKDKAISPHQQFMEKISARLREDIGDLMPDETLADLVSKNIEQHFLTDKIETVSNGFHGGTKTVPVPNQFRLLVAEIIKPRVEKHTQDYFEQSAAEIDKLISDLILEQCQTAFRQVVSSAVSGCFDSIAMSISSVVHSHLVNRQM